jgi:hypothetical protein
MMGVEDEHLVEEFSTEAAADPAFHDRVCSGARIVVLMIWIPSLAKTASNMLVNLESRSRIKNVNCGTWSPRSMSGLRACWATRSAMGCAVTPRMRTRRLTQPAGLQSVPPTQSNTTTKQKRRNASRILRH